MRANEAGAPLEFEQMLAALVQTLDLGDARLVRPAQGDWGIDVLVGDLAGRVTIWQAKYYPDGVDRARLVKIKDSFKTALRYAATHNYVIERWVLCVPCSLYPAVLQEWDQWRSAEQRGTGVQIDLWDEARLRELLMRPEAAHVAGSFYLDDEPARPAAVRLRVVPGGGPREGWHGGDEVRLDDRCYLLHDPVEELTAPDGAWVSRAATAGMTEPAPGRVRLRQVEVVRSGAAATLHRDALLAQAELLAAAGGRGGLPRRVALHRHAGGVTLVTAQPPGPTWTEAYQQRTPDRLGAAAALAALLPVGAALAELHRRGHAHRALDGDAVILAGKGREGTLRDAGLAGMPAAPGEGPARYRAPEQQLLVRRDGPGPHTDVYRLAALAYHTLAGHPPTPAPNPPVAATLPGFPPALDETLRRALDADPARRPALPGLIAELGAGRAALSRSGVA
ncbi:serine/threonine protein kinase [Dactylosporangium sp. AC04546]|uniref:serine/threonine protein kinase n=1 Tax=Dactylosporangium sp. AC04546 TaxID=2862460 RepID=UPI001EDE97B5|nr:serine/threonine protein kinase [Dactylosporangium sp. AC04546]WVK82568.1 serine/threonine protein kinase [Dactylosporangium sp. AC04546]